MAHDDFIVVSDDEEEVNTTDGISDIGPAAAEAGPPIWACVLRHASVS